MVQKSDALLVIDHPSETPHFDFLKQSYALHLAHNAADALEVLTYSIPDAVLLNANDLDTLEMIRTQNGQVPVILVTNHATRYKLEQGLHLGANDYLLKPIDRRLALTRIQLQVETQRKLAEQRARIAALEAAQQEQTRLARIIRHDLHNPLQNLQMAAALLEDHPQDHKIFDSMHYSLNTMHEMIDEFAEAFTIKAKVAVEPRSLSVLELIHSISAQYAVHAARKDITVEYGDVQGCIQADRKAMQRVLSNLVSNAVKYSPIGGTVRLWAETEGESVRICVADEGAGIPSEELHRLFTEFGRLSNRPTGQESSTGLGLWIVKRLMEAQGGEVGVTCPDDGGSVFWVKLPLAQATESVA